MEPRALRQAVSRVSACLAALAVLPHWRWRRAAYPGIGDGLTPAVAKRIPLCHLAKPVGDNHMDCYRTLSIDTMAEVLAQEVIQANTDFDGRERAPMRMAEARITLGVVRARESDLEGALTQGERALSGERKSLPSPGLLQPATDEDSPAPCLVPVDVIDRPRLMRDGS